MKLKSPLIQASGMKFECSRNFFADLQWESNVNNTEGEVEVKCSTCSPNEYTLANYLHIHNIENYKEETRCKPCPSGAVCNGVFRVLDDYWATGTSDGNLRVFPCPTGYCCSAKSTPCVSFDTCNKGRRGILCGSCQSGYMQSFLTDDCIPMGANDCNVMVFVFYLSLIHI